jgi:quercetin dioxygenase-like cupin family protein
MNDLPAVLKSLSPSLEPEEILGAMLRMPQANTLTEHEFCEGKNGAPNVYKRTFSAPANTFVAGRTHAIPSYSVLLKGKVVVWCEGKVMKIKAPYIFQSGAGGQKFVLTLKDSVWVNFFATHAKTVDDAEAEIIVPSPAVEAHRLEMANALKTLQEAI